MSDGFALCSGCAELRAKLAEAEKLGAEYVARTDRGLDALSAKNDELRAEVERLKEDDDALEMVCQKAMQARESAEARLRELREALTTIKEIVSDKFLHKHEKLEVIESRCDISLCNEALAKSHD